MSDASEIIVHPFITQEQMDSASELACPVPAIDIGEELTPAPVANMCESKQAIVAYEDLMYMPATRAFYLLSSEAVERIQHAESQLQSLFINVTDEEKYQGLAKAGLMDSFISADLASFLQGKNKEDFIQSRQVVQNPQQFAMQYVEQGSDLSKPSKMEQAISDYEKDRAHHFSQYKRLKAQALEQAKSLGYHYQSGELYSPREVKIQAEIKRYIKAKSEFLGKKELPPQEQIENLNKQVQQLKEFVERTSYSVRDSAEYAYQYHLSDLAKMQKALPDLMGAIESLAMYGIATPEFALADDMSEGHASLAQYYALQKQVEDIRNSINRKMEAADNASNKYATMLPRLVFKDELDKIKQLQEDTLKIKVSAQNNVMKSDRSMYLLWEPENYKIKPLSRLAKGNFPLREYVTLDKQPKNPLGNGLSQLRYLTLTQLPANQQQSLPNGNKILSSSSKANGLFYVESSLEQALLDLLGPHIKKVTVKKTWFDEKGIFEPQKLLDYLSQNHIQVNKLQGDISEWQKAMVELLYSDEIHKRLNPFDASPQAQMLRMVKSAKASSSASQLLNLTVSDYDKISIAKFEASAEFSAMRGEVNIFKSLTGKDYLRYPEQVDTSPIPVEYMDRQGKKQKVLFDNGALQLRFYCKAYGFMGACLEFAPEVALTARADKDSGSHLALTGYKVMREDGVLELDSIKAFISAEAGIELGMWLDWHLPKNIPAFALDGVASNNNTVLPMMRAAVKVDTSMGVNFPIRFRMKSGRPCAIIQVGPPGAKIAFEGELDPSAIGIWVTQFQRLLRQCKYRKITLTDSDEPELADKESFAFMTHISRAMLYTQLNVGLFLAQDKDKLDEILSFFGRSERAGMLGNILSNPQDEAVLREWLVLQPPEAIGPMLRTLIAEPEAFKETDAQTGTEKEHSQLKCHVWQQTAIANIIKWLHQADDCGVCYSDNQVEKVNPSQRQMEEAMVRMNTGSDAPSVYPLRVEALFNHREELVAFMQTVPTFGATQKEQDLKVHYYRSIASFERQLDKLLIHTKYLMTNDMKQQIETAKSNEFRKARDARYVN